MDLFNYLLCGKLDTWTCGMWLKSDGEFYFIEIKWDALGHNPFKLIFHSEIIKTIYFKSYIWMNLKIHYVCKGVNSNNYDSS